MSPILNIHMYISPPSAPISGGAPPDASHDYESLVMDACQILSETDCQFRVSGFGQDDWPVDVSYDLSTVMEQLPEAMRSLQCDEPATIDFYGQGVERCLTFTPRDDLVVVECASSTQWQPNPSVEEAPLNDVLSLFGELRRQFKRSLEQACPILADVQPFKSW